MQSDLKVKDIYNKVIQLAEQKQYWQELCRQLKDENTILSNKLAEVSELKEELNEKLEEAERRYRSKFENEPKEKARLKKRIEQYVKDIDDCVEWLQNT